MRLPPGVSNETFEAAIRGFEQAVGKDWVFTSEEDTDLYRDAYSPFWDQPEEKLVSAAVAPANVEEVQQVVRIANQYKIPIYPISTGRNLGYGGSAPVLSGSVVLDLKRMNRVLEISEKNAYVLVEPGVSYFDLYRYIRDRGLKVWIDCPDPGWGSLIGNALDRGGGYTRPQFRNHFDAHCGMEVVLANGEVMRTGMGAMPNAETWQQYKTGFGPWIDGMFSQSNFGVVTKMGFWLMPQPEAYFTGVVKVPRYKDLIPLVDTLNLLENGGVCNGMTSIGSPLLTRPIFGAAAAQDPELAQILAKPDGGSPAELEAYALRKQTPYWSCGLKFYGPAKVIAAQWEHAKEQFAAIQGATFEDGELLRLPLTDEQMKRSDLAEFGIPSLSIFAIGARSETNPTPGNGHIWFSPIIPRTGEAILEANRVFAETARELKLPTVMFSPPFSFWERSFVFINFFPITRNPEIDRKNREAFKVMIKKAAEHGWGEYRTATTYYDDVMETYSFNNHALLRFHETVKDAVDPNGILAAGRYGIWPKHIRDTKT